MECSCDGLQDISLKMTQTPSANLYLDLTDDKVVHTHCRCDGLSAVAPRSQDGKPINYKLLPEGEKLSRHSY